MKYLFRNQFLGEVLTLKLSNEFVKKELVIKKIHILLLAIATLVITSGSIILLNSYIATKENLINYTQLLEDVKKENYELQKKSIQLEIENNNYNNQLSEIEQKAIDIESKLTEIENLKDTLTSQLQNMDTFVSIPNIEKKFSPLVLTSYSKISSISNSIQYLDTKINKNNFTSIANNFLSVLKTKNSAPLSSPVNGKITSRFSLDGGLEGRVHKGIDIATPTGTPVKATANGTIIISRYSNSFGYYVAIDNGNGFETLFAHNSKLNCNVGDIVKRGDIIAYSGSTGDSTGPHVHYEIKLNGKNINPENYL